ncbi:hypothetical protein [Methylobacterium sp. Leaf85]|uniref:hypothetical protein n=1 Tax=Methylobacterium sp. Leaf85 TaxID=1736241 RepID=UPI0006F8B188|nr:hypothetical protein [Methylobacterium sp. Leaf85]KQO51925.1 hypothetical protein ASF08_04220 [Methylobacterium sp. Leaf85]
MAAPLQTRGSTSAAYRDAFRAVTSLWRETGLVALALIVQSLLSARMSGSKNSSGSLTAALIEIAVTVLLVPYTMAIYRHVLGLRPESAQTLLNEAMRRKDLIAYHLGWFLIGILWARVAILPMAALGLLMIPAFVLTIWLTSRLFTVGPTLAIEGLEVTPQAAFRATAGQVWTIFYIGFRVALPLVALALLLGVLVFASSDQPAGRAGTPPSILTEILILPFSLFGLVLRAVLEAQVFRDLGLFSPRREVG